MFTVGEFSKLARVSKRLLRYYDEIGLLKPVKVDLLTGYRYYRAEQLPRLNRILALKDLGLSLDQIQRMLSGPLSTEEMQGMLLLKKTEIEQQVSAELQRIRTIEARLQFLRQAETGEPVDVVIKQIPVQPAMTVRTTLTSFEDGAGIFGQIMAALPEKKDPGLYFAILHSDGLDEQDFDVEVGRTTSMGKQDPIDLPGGLQLCYQELPAVDRMATFAVKGPVDNLLVGHSLIGTWAEANGYRLAGLSREVALQLPQKVDWSDAVTEIQYPVEPEE